MMKCETVAQQIDCSCLKPLTIYNPIGSGWASGKDNTYINREDFRKGDPDLSAIIEGFLSLYWAYTAKIAGEFDGMFPLVYDDESTYANKSQYLKDVALVGNNNTSIIASDLCNILAGNPGNNTFWPKKGVDYIGGDDGEDIVFFTVLWAEYRIEKRGNNVIVTDAVVNRDGDNALTNIDKIRFSD